MAIEYDTAIDGSKLSTSLFCVEGRAITKAYANSAPEKAANGGNGRFVVIELATVQTTALGPGEGRGGRGPSGGGRGDPGPGGRAMPVPVVTGRAAVEVAGLEQ